MKRNTPRRIILMRDGSICQYCGDYGNQIEHVIPWSSTQDDSLGNLVVACSWCNAIVGSKEFISFEAKREWILRARGIPERIPEQLPKHVCDGCSSRKWCVAESVCYSQSYASRGPTARLLADFAPVPSAARPLDSPQRAAGAEQISETEKIESEWISALRRARIVTFRKVQHA